jgi:hypothetical protein
MRRTRALTATHDEYHSLRGERGVVRSIEGGDERDGLQFSLVSLGHPITTTRAEGNGPTATDSMTNQARLPNPVSHRLRGGPLAAGMWDVS